MKESQEIVATPSRPVTMTPPCVYCGKPVDLLSTEEVFLLSAGWIHGDCRHSTFTDEGQECAVCAPLPCMFPKATA